MTRLTVISLIILLSTSCSTISLLPKAPDNTPTKKEIRRAKRAHKKLNKLTARFPELKRTEIIPTPITIKTPEIKGVIIKPFLIPGKKEYIKLPRTTIFTHPTVRENEPFDVHFSDPHLDARFTFDGVDYMLDYTILSIPIDTIVKIERPTIQPIEYVTIALTWWQKLWINMGKVFFGIIIVATLIGVFRLLNTKY